MKPLHLYYAVKPLIPSSGHLALRRLIAKRSRRRSAGKWPIIEGAASPPPGWRGWPDGKQFCFVLTHDVEGSLGRDQSLRLAELEASKGFRSSFNFVPEAYDTPRSLRDQLVAMGFEIGVHGLKHDGFLYRSRAVFRNRARKINGYLKDWNCRGFRSPYMHHDLDWLRDLEIDYDASTFDTDPFEPQADGAGTIYPFYVKSGDEDEGYIELPYTLTQDSTLFLFLQEPSIDIWKRKLDWIASKGGMALLITHPDYMCFDPGNLRPKQFPVELYGQLLDYVEERYADKYWAALPREVAEFWRENVKTRIFVPNVGLQDRFSSVLVGTESILVHCGEQILENGHRIDAVVSTAPDIKSWAGNHDIEVLDSVEVLESRFRAKSFDYLFSIGNFKVVPASTLRLPAIASINYHDGPLPDYAGLNVPTWALMNQEKSHGITWHLMEGKVDAGAIVKQVKFPLDSGETALSLNTKSFDAAIDEFSKLLDDLAGGGLKTVPQDSGEGQVYPLSKRVSGMGLIDWTQCAETIEATVRALDFGGYQNTLSLPKLLRGKTPYLVLAARAVSDSTNAAAGEIVSSGSSLVIATGRGQLDVTRLATLDGRELTASEFADLAGGADGLRLDKVDAELVARLTELDSKYFRRESRWIPYLRDIDPLNPAFVTAGGDLSAGRQTTTIALRGAGPDALEEALNMRGGTPTAVCLAMFLARYCDQFRFTLGYCDAALVAAFGPVREFFAFPVPWTIELDPEQDPLTQAMRLQAELASLRKWGTYPIDLWARTPALKELRDSPQHRTFQKVTIVAGVPAGERLPAEESAIAFYVTSDGRSIDCSCRGDIVEPGAIEDMMACFETFAAQIQSAAEVPLCKLPIIPQAQRLELVERFNETDRELVKECGIHDLIAAQARRTPDDIAVIDSQSELTYGSLDAAAERLARHLLRLGLEPDAVVGVHLNRSADLMVALLAILKTGSAYLPLDPAFPQSRIELMLEDAGVEFVLTEDDIVAQIDGFAGTKVLLKQALDSLEDRAGGSVSTELSPGQRCYLIYTSGSTGRPKGVEVTHRNVVNLFLEMDSSLDIGEPGTWLAVSSLSFDISVLELFWPLTRGYSVVVSTHSHEMLLGSGWFDQQEQGSGSTKAPDFSLFYFASDESGGDSSGNKYHLLLEGAKFADEHGFAAVWTPERHFHAFGGLYPNPSVVSAAIAVTTKRISIRAGSCVLPLHHPARVAEEWALVDNLSGGRTGIAFAAGWQPNDFVIRPENHAARKEVMFRDIDVVQKLWRGESVGFPDGEGKDVEVVTRPRPIQNELPTWVTVAGNPETFVMAGERGLFVLTHLLGQSISDLESKIIQYREAWRAAGHAGDGHVTIMLHTLVGESVAAVKREVHDPMVAYLRSAFGLVREAAWTFPTFKARSEETGKNPLEILDTEEISQDDMDALLEHSFERYFETSGLFGTPNSVQTQIDSLARIGVNEIACLIDYGVPTDVVIGHFGHLDDARKLSARARERSGDSFAELIRRHKVTHFQCTPSMAKVLMTDEDATTALGKLKVMLVGGEELPRDLGNSLSQAVGGKLFNVYGPTETTVWSSIAEVRSGEAISLGRPIANTQLYVLDQYGSSVPRGIPGELYIGGLGVALGYHHRPELTGERFVSNPFSDDSESKLYRTGDLVRYRRDNSLEFLGRSDFQVKVRGYRIELSEIEAALRNHPDVKDASVIAETDAHGAVRLRGFLLAADSGRPSPEALRDHLAQSLPSYMIPGTFQALESFPFTPNGKLDRRALLELERADPNSSSTDIGKIEEPKSAAEKAIAGLFETSLGVRPIALDDDFFALGGHSLLAVQIVMGIEKQFDKRLALATLFRSPTVRQLAQEIGGAESESDRWSPFVRLAAEGTKPPLFLFHSHGGNVLEYHPFAATLDVDRPIWALQSIGLDGNIVEGLSIEEMAAIYVDAIRQQRPSGPYVLGGFCLGGLLALEAAIQLTERGESVPLVAMFNSALSHYPSYPQGTSRARQASNRMRMRMALEWSIVTGHADATRWTYLKSRFNRSREILQGQLEIKREARSRRRQSPESESPNGDRAPHSLAYIHERLHMEHHQAYSRYRSKPYDGRVFLVRAEQQPRGIKPDPLMGWSGILTGEVELATVPGFQQTMLRNPAMQVLSRHLAAELEKLPT